MSYFNEMRSLLNRTRGWTPEEQFRFEGLLTDAVKDPGQRSQLEELFMPRPLAAPLAMPWVRPRLAGFSGSATGAHWDGAVPIRGQHHFEAHLYGGDWLPHVKNLYVREAAWIAASNVTLQRTISSYDLHKIISTGAATVLSRPVLPQLVSSPHADGHREDQVMFWLGREGEDPLCLRLCLRHNGGLVWPGFSSTGLDFLTKKLAAPLNLPTHSEWNLEGYFRLDLTPAPVPLSETPGVWRGALDKLFNLKDPNAGFILLRDPALYPPSTP